MRKINISILLILVISLGSIPLSFLTIVSAGTTFELPDYEPAYIESGLVGDVPMPSVSGEFSAIPAESGLASATPPVGTTVYDWYVGAVSGNPDLTLRGIGDFVEVWVAEELSFPEGDPRNDDPYNTMITDEMVQYLVEEFDNIIYQTCVTYFGQPLDRDGSSTIFELIGWPEFTWDWIASENPQRVILKVLNIDDENYYDPTYPYYTVGFYSSTYTVDYYNRNMIHIDSWRWWQRLGPEGFKWFPEDRPDLEVTRPYVYESTTAHEFQHLIHRDFHVDPAGFMNEGCSMYSELLCGYGIDAGYLNSYFATPDNSLTVWSDQGGINILADYGVSALWTTYLSDHFGGADLIKYYVQEGVPGVEGINAALSAFGYDETFDQVYHDFRLANLIRSDYPGHGKYNYKSLDLNAPEINPLFTNEVSGLPVVDMKGTDFGNTITTLGYDTGISTLGPFGTDYITFTDWNKPAWLFFDGDDYAAYGWTLTSEGWYSGSADLYNVIITANAFVDPVDPTLTIITKYEIEALWDFGFVQVSTDDGATWTSLENEFTTADHDPSAHPDVLANLPGLTGENPDWPDWTTMSFDLTAYAGQDIVVGFHYITDWATTEEGWYLSGGTVSGVPLELTPVYLEASFQVTVVHAIVTRKQTIFIPWDIRLDDENSGYTISYAKDPTYVILVVTPTMEQGMTDYSFDAHRFKFCKLL